MSALIQRATITSIVAQRNKALTLYERAYDAMVLAQEARVEASKAASQATCGLNRYNYHSNDARKGFLGTLDVPKRTDFLGEARRLTDIDSWSHIIELTSLEKLMDKKAKDQFTQQLVENPPEVTEDNVQATLEQFMVDAGTIWKRGIAEAFSKLDRRFKSHDGWKVGSRIVLTNCFNEYGGFSYGSNHADTLQDIERVFMVLDDREIPERFAGIVGQVEASRKGGFGVRQSYMESEFFKVRGFMNGNAHVWFKRDDLVEKVNKLLGEFYDAPIPHEREATDDGGLRTPKTTLAKNYGFFPTPQDAAERLIETAGLYRSKDQTPLTVLEPSAGTGNLVRLIEAKGATVDAVEIHPDRARELRQAMLCRRVLQCDFLQAQPPAMLYDRVVMNPPFDRERDIDHVMHALKFLKPEGRLVAIMSAGTEFRETRKSQAFRDLMARMNARWTDLPAGSFASVGTYCNTVILQVRKDGKAVWS